MAARFGDANENGNDYCYDQDHLHPSKRRSTKYSSAIPNIPHHGFVFKAFTKESLIEKRKNQELGKKKSVSHLDPTRQILEPEPYLASGQQLPPALVRQLPGELIGKPMEDIDPYYDDKETFVIISRGKELTRFSATKALYLLGPFHPIRRVVLYILVNPLFNLFVILTILTNCILMTIQGSEMVERTEIIFTIIYTTEMGLKVLARGFIMDEFTYLRDPWNWLDFAVIIMAYLTIVIQDLGNLSVMRTFRVLRALKTVAIIPGMKTIVGAVIDSVKNLKDVVVLTLFSLSVFSLLGLQIYMGQLTQKCILNGPSNMSDSEWFSWCNNSSHWVPEPDDEIFGAYRLCGNATGAQSCPSDHTCLQGFGPNPDYGYTNFDTFGWALICSFRLMTQDFWEGLYMQVLKTAGSWHIMFFIVSIFLGSIYLMNLILAIVAMSYNELQRRAEEEEEAEAEDEAAFLESCRMMDLQEQMSDFSNSTTGGGSGGRTSYRPSIEIGLVGQSLLASLCQNGLLGRNVSDKLNQQMILPGIGNPGIRSQSLCVNFERQDSLKFKPAQSQQQINPPTGAIDGSNNRQHIMINGNTISNEPPLTASSLTELHKRNSVVNKPLNNININNNNSKFNENEALINRRQVTSSPRDYRHSQSSILNQTHHSYHNNNSGESRRTSAVEVHQNNSNNNKLSQQYRASSSILSTIIPPSNSSNITGDRSARSSVTSDKDLVTLRQKAAMIKIVSDDYSDQKHEGDKLCQDKRVVHSLDTFANKQIDNLTESAANRSVNASPIGGSREMTTISREGSNKHISSPFGGSSDFLRRKSGFANESIDENKSLEVTSKSRTKSQDYTKNADYDRLELGHFVQASQFRSEAAICKQPTSVQNQNSPLNCSYYFQKPLKRSNAFKRYRLASNASDNSTDNSFDSNKSSLNIPQQQLQLQQQQQHQQQLLQQSVQQQQRLIGGSTRTLNPKVLQTGPTMGSASNVQQLGIYRCRQAENMHHLSVENFQRFGSIRDPVQDQPQLHQNPSMQVDEQYQQQQQQQQQQMNKSIEQMNEDNDDNLYETAQRSRGRLLSRPYIHPSTMMRTSFSSARPRPSIIPGGYYGVAGGGGGTPSNNANLQSHRRMSQDFVRRASNWSRLSMSTNVDLRRLLRLWSHTNPYQPRPSVSSFQSANYNYSNYESPVHSIKDAGGGGGGGVGGGKSNYATSENLSYNSPRPSSISSTRQAYELISAVSRRRSRFRSDARYPYAMPLDDNMIDRMSVNMRDKSLAYCLSCLDILCIWECCGAWLKIQKIISLVVFDPFTELFIILCILINTLFMALDSDDADVYMKSIFERGNYFFTATFAVEASMKIMALSPKFYFREGWNVFDSIIVGLSLLELGLEGVYGLSVLRSFRLLRVFKLAKSWPTLNLLISIMGKAVGDLGNLTFVLAIIVFIFAVMGMQLFGNKYVDHNFPSGELPRWNFTDFMHSFMIVFRILCAEWIEPMWDCLLVGGWPCIPFFLIAVTVGNLVVLNLFLALLLASFGASNLSSPQADNVDTKKLQEAIARFSRFARWIRSKFGSLISLITSTLLGKSRNQTDANDDERGSNQGKCVKSHIVAMSKLERLKNIEQRTQELKTKIRRSPEHHYHLRQLAKSQLKEGSTKSPEVSISSGYNYNYSRAATQYNGTTMNIPNIPIIVNEATEIDEEKGENEGIGEIDEDGFQNLSFKYKKRTIRDNSPPINSILQEVSEFNEDQASIAELYQSKLKDLKNSEMSSNKRQQQQQQPVTPTAASRHPSYFVNMQPIREDSRDAESTTSLSENDSISKKKTSEDISKANDAFGSSNHNFNSRESMRSPLNNKECNKLQSASSSLSSCSSIFRSSAQEAEEAVRERLIKATIQIEPTNLNKSNEKIPEIDVRNVAEEQRYYQVNQKEDENAEEEEEEQRPKSSLYLRPQKKQDMEEDDERTLQYIESYIERCICIGIICLKWFLFRQYVRKIVEHKYFDQCILVLIVISSGTLALEDKHLNERPNLKRTLDVLDTIFTIVFSLEMIFKWLAFGIRRYFGNIWSWLDFVIVLVSFINLMASIFGSGKIQALKTMRTLRAMRGLRPLRALQRFQGMRVVVNALIQAIPSIFNVLLVCLIFWLIFSIMGVQMFGGKFWRCLNPETLKVVSYEEAANRHECIERNLTWANPQINFDNVLNAYLALFQVATFKGWIDIMNSATDSRMRDDQPIREANIYMYFYFVFFVIFGSFFTLNLFIGVIIDNFNEQKKKTGGSLEIFMTEDQKKYYHAMKKMKSKRPIKAMTRPKLKLQAFLFDVTTSKKFDMAIMIIIGLNMFVMALEHYGQSQEFSLVLENLNLIFIAIFTLECLCKIFAMRHFYFREPWNVFDFIVVDLSILGVVMKEYVAKYFVSPTLLRVVRVVKVGRVLRLVKGAKGIRTLLFALAMSLPALFNICLLLFLVMFIYAIFGMSFFMNVRPRAGIDETFNFETFTSSIIVLFQMSTSAGWDLVLDPLMDEENNCQKPDPTLNIEGTCGNKSIAIFYLISYVIVTFLIIINMYIAVILENYSQATEDVQEGLTDDDYEMYYEIWQKFDPNGTQYLPYSKLSDFVDALEDPLRIAKPNELALVALDINIYQGEQCYCVDILDALTKFFFTRKGLVIQVNEHLQKVQSTLHETPFERITTTYLVKRQHYCAKVIQNCWRKWKERTQRRSTALTGSRSESPVNQNSDDNQNKEANENHQCRFSKDE